MTSYVRVILALIAFERRILFLNTCEITDVFNVYCLQWHVANHGIFLIQIKNDTFFNVFYIAKNKNSISNVFFVGIKNVKNVFCNYDIFAYSHTTLFG